MLYRNKKIIIEKRIDKATRDKISFTTYIVPEFAAAYKMWRAS